MYCGGGTFRTINLPERSDGDMAFQPHTSYQVTLGKNPERSRDHNRRVVLDVVRRNGPLGVLRGAASTIASLPAAGGNARRGVGWAVQRPPAIRRA